MQQNRTSIKIYRESDLEKGLQIFSNNSFETIHLQNKSTLLILIINYVMKYSLSLD